jgi:uncharacterized protein (TIGR03435 family)
MEKILISSTKSFRSPFLPLAVFLLASVAASYPAGAQTGLGEQASKGRSGGDPTNEFKFEVISIKPIQRGPGVQLAITNPTPNGFTATATLWQLVAFAYRSLAPAWKVQVWQKTEMRNEPSGFEEQVYAIDARVSHSEVEAWQNQDKRTQDLLHVALRAALKERFKLALHKESAQRTIFELAVSKRGPRLKPAASDAVLPVGMKLESGGVMTGIGPKGSDGWDFHGATMQDLADRMLQSFLDGPVRDRTGLTGRYDFQVRIVPTPGEERGYDYDAYSLSDLGLELKRGTENRPILVIDHVERPTPN